MAARLLLAPVGGGKTAAALAAVVQKAERERLARIWVLLASRRQETAFRQRLLTLGGGQQAYFNIEFFGIYDLYRRALDAAGQPTRRLDEIARLRLLRTLLGALAEANELGPFATIAQLPGFVRVAADFIYELKQNLVRPEVFEAAAESQKDHALARIYAHYQGVLRENNLVDREGEGWLALALAAELKALGRDVALFVADGFDHFTPLQAAFITSLAARTQEALLTLSTVSGQEQTVGRRFSEARALLQNWAGAALLVEEQDAEGGRPHELQVLMDRVFWPGAATDERDAAERLRLLEAPAPLEEARAVLRAVKRLLLERDAQPDDVLIALRDWERYQAHFAALGRRYGVPLALHYGSPLAQNPAIVALLDLLDLHRRGAGGLNFRWRELLDVLRSPYFDVPGLNSGRVAVLEWVSYEAVVRGGRSNWLNALQWVSREREVHDDDERRAGRRLSDGEAANIAGRLNAFFDAVTPPSKATTAGYVRWFEDLIGPDPLDEASAEPGYTVAMLAQLRRPSGPGVVEQDLIALQALKRVLRGMMAAEALLGNVAPVTWREFLADLQAGINYAALDAQPERSGRVLVTTATNARGLPHRHVFIPGLAEGVFPAAQREDPLYMDEERQELTRKGVLLETQAARAGDDALFYELSGLARESLTLSRPTTKDGAPWIESYFWRAVRALFPNIQPHDMTIGAVVAAEEAASVPELALAIAHELTGAALQPASEPYYNWLLAARGDYWARIRHGARIETRRMMSGPHDQYSGQLRDAALIARLREKLGPQHIWSASQFNEYGACPFRYFARRLLMLEELEPPEEGIDALQLGTLNHEILEGAYSRIVAEDLLIAPENAERALQILDEEAAVRFATAQQDLGFRSALWAQEQVVLLSKLRALVQHDFEHGGPDSKRVAALFGNASRRPYRLEADFIDYPLLLNNGEVVKAIGFIDRIDRVGDAAVVMDYKSGTAAIDTVEHDDLRRGRNFQMMLYLLGAQHLLRQDDSGAPARVAGGFFWHIANSKASGVFDMDEHGELLERGVEHVSRYVAAARQGDFSVQPNRLEDGKCTRYCEFYQLCRVSVSNRGKAGSP